MAHDHMTEEVRSASAEMHAERPVTATFAAPGKRVEFAPLLDRSVDNSENGLCVEVGVHNHKTPLPSNDVSRATTVAAQRLKLHLFIERCEDRSFKFVGSGRIHSSLCDIARPCEHASEHAGQNHDQLFMFRMHDAVVTVHLF